MRMADLPNTEMWSQFLGYIREREIIRIRRSSRADRRPPWTDDPILKEYKFTNVKREYDRTTRFFRELYRHNNKKPKEEILLNCGIYRYFGTIEFAAAIGWQSKWDPNFIIQTAKNRLHNKERVFTGAYVITNQGIKAPKEEVVVNVFLQPFAEKVDELSVLAKYTNSWEVVHKRLMTVPGFGGTGFMAKEVLLDAILTPVLMDCDDEDTWSPCGPGGRRGLNRLYGRPVNARTSETQCLDELRYLQKETMRDVDEWVGFRILNVHDIQWNCCEFDKYMRIKNKEGRVRSKYKPRKSSFENIHSDQRSS